MQNEFIALRGISRFDQASATLSVSRRLSSYMDISLFSSYSRLLASRGPVIAGQGIEGYGRAGLQFLFHFPRVSSE
jgi:hypothetical protein